MWTLRCSLSQFSEATTTSAAHGGGTPAALIAALALAIGLALGDAAVVLLGGLGMRRLRAGTVMWIRRALAAVVGVLGIWLCVTGILG